ARGFRSRSSCYRPPLLPCRVKDATSRRQGGLSRKNRGEVVAGRGIMSRLGTQALARRSNGLPETGGRWRRGWDKRKEGCKSAEALAYRRITPPPRPRSLPAGWPCARDAKVPRRPP